MKKVIAVSILLPLTLIVIPNVNAADSGGSTPTPTPTPEVTANATPTAQTKSVATELASSRQLIDSKNFTAALAELKTANQEFPNNADINNLLGYSSRKLKKYSQAATYYKNALKLDPKHLGALEYQGELFVETKKMADAKKNLAKLKKLCGTSCEEYLDLKKFIGKK